MTDHESQTSLGAGSAASNGAGEQESRIDAFLAETAQVLGAIPASTPSEELRELMAGSSPVPVDDVFDVEPARSLPMIATRTARARASRYGLLTAMAAAAAAVVAVAGWALLSSAGPTDDLASASGGDRTEQQAQAQATTTTAVEANSALQTTGPAGTDIAVIDAGSATVDIVDGALTLIGATPAAGWRVVEETAEGPGEIELSYRRGDDRVDLRVEISDGTIRARIRDRRTGERFEVTAVPTTVIGGQITTTTIDGQVTTMAPTAIAPTTTGYETTTSPSTSSPTTTATVRPTTTSSPSTSAASNSTSSPPTTALDND
jgi:hypothetical protein